MSELQDMLRVQARLHRKQGANALGDLFQSAALEIEILTERLENPQGLQELICVEQMKEISLPEIHRANQKLHEQLAKANERARELENSNARMLHEVANQYDGNDSTEWSIGANHVFRLFAKWISKNEQLRKEQDK